MRPKLKRLLWIAPLAVLGMALFIALGGTVIRLLWNALLPPLFGFPQVTFWQALGVLVLSRILFGGFGGGHSGRRSRMRRRMEERCAQMTPEEREGFRQRMRQARGFEADSQQTNAE
jgi:hypothetical protein